MGDDRRTRLGLLGISLAFAALELWSATVAPWELFHDELYYWAGALRPGLGYVDHPPLAPWLLAASVSVFGDGMLGFRIVPALCGAGVVFLAGLIARSLGAGSYGQLLAALSAAISTILLVFSSFYSVNAIELLLWAGGLLVLAELMRTGNQQLWLAFGVIAGLGLLVKHTFLLLPFSVGVGLVLTPLRTQLLSRWLGLGAAVALIIALPNLYWNAVNDWPSLAFYTGRGANLLDATLGDALLIQIMLINPANLLICVPGVAFLLFGAGRRYRALGIAFLVLFAVILLFGQRRGDRIAGIYPIALAAGATMWEIWKPRHQTAVRAALVMLLLLFGAFVVPGSIPALSPEGVVEYFEALGEKPEIEEADVGVGLPVHLSGRLDWERFADKVYAAWQTLPSEERDRSAVLASHWVYASVIEYYGREKRFAPVIAPHNAYSFWTAEAAGRDIVVSVMVDEEVLPQYFARSRVLDRYVCERCPGYRRNVLIAVSYEPVRPLPELLADWRHFGIGQSPALVPDDP